MLVVLVVVGLLVLGGGGIYLLAGGDDDDSGQDASTSTTGVDGAGSSSPTGGQEGDGSGPAPVGGEDPEEVVQTYIAAATGGDCQTMISVLTENMLAGMTPEMAVDECELLSSQDPESMAVFSTLELNTTEDDGEVATVDGTGDLDGSPLLIVFTLVREGDTWLIDNIG